MVQIYFDLLLKKMNRMAFPTRKLPLILIGLVCVIVYGFYFKLTKIYELQQKCLDNLQSIASERHVRPNMPFACSVTSNKPKYFLSAKNPNGDHLQHVRNVFTYLGYERAEKVNDNWNVLWSFEYPYPSVVNSKRLNSHQRVNHFPGSGYLTSKVYLATSKLRYIPTAFSLPKDKQAFLNYASKHKDKLWVQKSSKHRGITIKAVNELDLAASDTFVQEFVQKPFLVDGRKFDIGLYTVITSIDPLRVYVLKSEWLMRYCSENYYPFDVNNPLTYVIGDDYTPSWQLPSLKKVYESLNFSHKKSFLHYVKKQGHDPVALEKELYKAVAETIVSKKPDIMKSVSKYPFGSRSFFELVRFDLVVDSDLNVYLMEVNMSPNLSSAHFQPNAVMYEQVIFNTLSLAGLSRSSPHDSSIDTTMVNDRDIQVYDQECFACSNCDSDLCKLCLHCMTESVKTMIKDAQREHLNRVHCTRVYPLPSHVQESFSNYTNLSSNDKLMHLWYRGKCIENKIWCY